MKDLALGLLVKSFLLDEFAGENIYVGSPVEADAIRMPAVLIDVSSTAVVGSELYRGTLSLAVNTLCESTSEQAHRTLCQRVDARARLLKGVADLVVEVAGIVATDVRQNPTDNHWSSTMQYTIGFS